MLIANGAHLEPGNKFHVGNLRLLKCDIVTIVQFDRDVPTSGGCKESFMVTEPSGVDALIRTRHLDLGHPWRLGRSHSIKRTVCLNDILIFLGQVDTFVAGVAVGGAFDSIGYLQGVMSAINLEMSETSESRVRALVPAPYSR